MPSPSALSGLGEEQWTSQAPNVGDAPLPSRGAPVKITSIPTDCVRRIFAHLLDIPELGESLSPRVLEESGDAFALASTCKYLRSVFKTSFTAIEIAWDTSVYMRTLATVFGPSLETISIDSHARSEAFLQTLHRHPETPSLRFLRLTKCAAPPKTLRNILSRSPPLRELHLSYVHTQDFFFLISSLAPYLSSLSVLHLQGVSTLTHAALLAACKAAGSNLRSFALRYARHPSITGETLTQVALACPELTSLFLDDIRHAPAAAVKTMCQSYGQRLENLRLFGTHLLPVELLEVLESCSQLIALGLEEKSWSQTQVLDALGAVVRQGQHVRSLYLRDVKGIVDRDVENLANNLPNLSSLELRRQVSMSPRALDHLQVLGLKLKRLDMRGCRVDDKAMETLGRVCTQLEVVRLGGDGEFMQVTDLIGVGVETLTNAGLDILFAGCGHSLHEFTWDQWYVFHSMQNAYAPPSFPVHFFNVSGTELARSLASLCPRLHRVEVNGLRPPGRERVARGKFDLAFMELYETLPSAEVLVDSERPF